MTRILLTILIAAWSSFAALAHEVRPAYLELRQVAPERYTVLWKVPGLGDELRLALYVEMPNDSVTVAEPKASFVNNAFIERWSVQRPGGLAGAAIRISGLDATLTDVLVRVERLNGSMQVARLTPATPSFVVDGMSKTVDVAGTYLKLGVEHILLGYDHLLFVLALIMIVTGTRRLVATVTAFTLAHSITLTLATLGIVDLPGPPIEAAIALSIVFVAAEGVRLWQGQSSLSVRYPWIVAFIFGLLHGFGFAGALMEIGLPQHDILLALLMFNLGVEIGQLLFIGAILTIRLMIQRSTLPKAIGNFGRPLVTYSIGTLATVWFFERLIAIIA